MINAFSLTGVLIVPLMKTHYMKYAFAFFIALAIGTLFSTAILQLLPEVCHPSIHLSISHTLTAHKQKYCPFGQASVVISMPSSSCLCFLLQVFLGSNKHCGKASWFCSALTASLIIWGGSYLQCMFVCLHFPLCCDPSQKKGFKAFYQHVRQRNRRDNSILLTFWLLES